VTKEAGPCDDDALHLLAHDHFAEDEARFNRFAESDVVGDKEIYARHLERAKRVRLRTISYSMSWATSGLSAVRRRLYSRCRWSLITSAKTTAFQAV
jgi:hypothetical protein